MADWNRSPEEVGSSYFAKYLKGAIVAPNVLMTCSSTAEGGGRVLDFGLASNDIASKIQCEANYKVPFKPHFVGVDFSIDLGYVADTGQQLVIPTDLFFAKVPDFLNIRGQDFSMKRWETNCNWISPLGAMRTQLLPTFLPDLATPLKGLSWLLIPAPRRV